MTTPVVSQSQDLRRVIGLAGGIALIVGITIALTTYFVVVEWAALIFAVGAVFVLRRKLVGAPGRSAHQRIRGCPLCS